MTVEAMTVSRDDLHALVDGLPEREFSEAHRLLAALSEPNPARRAALLAPIDDEPITPDDRRAINEAKAAYKRGDWIADNDLEL